MAEHGVGLNDSSLNLINAAEEFPGDQDSVILAAIKGSSRFPLLVFIHLHFPIRPRVGLLPKLSDWKESEKS